VFLFKRLKMYQRNSVEYIYRITDSCNQQLEISLLSDLIVMVIGNFIIINV